MEENIEQPIQQQPESSLNQSFQYISCISIDGRPILPPLLTNEKRQEMTSWRTAAVNREAQLRLSRRSSVCSSDGINQMPQSTPTRPASLNLHKRAHISIANIGGYKDTLEHRLALGSESESEGTNEQTESMFGKGGIMCGEEETETPDTVTGSPKNGGLPRQNSYTLPFPGPALLNYLAKEQDHVGTGRRTWDLESARDAWHSQRPLLSDQGSDDLSDESHMTQVPFTDDVPSSIADHSGQSITVPNVKEEMNSLTEMMMTLKMRHDQQRLELEERQLEEKEKFESLFRKKISDLLGLKKSASVAGGERMRGDNGWGQGDGAAWNMMPRSVRSAGDARTVLRPPHRAENGRPRSADPFGSVTDIDISLREDSYVSKVVHKCEDACETWSLSSHASTLSNEPIPTTYRITSKYKQASPAELERINKAASKICAGVRGYLTRRLMRTEHVKDLFRSFRDTIHIAKTLKDAKDLNASDVNFMIGLTRQITSNWDAIYQVFLGTSITQQMQIIAADRIRLQSAHDRTPVDSARKLSSATVKSLSRKKRAMSKSLTTFPRSSSFSRSCYTMSASLSGALPPARP